MTLTVRDFETALKAYAMDAADRKGAGLTDLAVLGGLAAEAFFGLHPQPPLSRFFYALGTLVIMVAVSFFLLRAHIAPNRKRQ